MNWTFSQKMAFRFFGIYFFLFAMSNQFLPSFAFDAMWQKIAPWFGKTFLDVQIDTFSNGSGDTTYNYVCLLLYAVIAFFSTMVWSILDRSRQNYNSLLQWFTLLIRLYIFYQMVLYGLAKLFYLQFQPPGFWRLIQPYGDSSPMGILWTFMGQSKGYTIFAGLGEFVGGMLLLHRRTTLLGSLIVFGVMANVMAMNFFYDVPVKILSSHLVLMSLFLIVLNYKNLLNIFLLNRPTHVVEHLPYFKNPKLERAKNITKWILVIVGLILGIFQLVKMKNQYGPDKNKPKLYGLYEVEQFIRNKDTIPPLNTDETRWDKLIFERKNNATIYSMDSKSTSYKISLDSLDNFFTMTNSDYGSDPPDTLYFTQIDSTHFRFEGVFYNDSIQVMTSRKLKEDFLLRKTKFKWINEKPFNR